MVTTNNKNKNTTSLRQEAFVGNVGVLTDPDKERFWNHTYALPFLSSNSHTITPDPEVKSLTFCEDVGLLLHFPQQPRFHPHIAYTISPLLSISRSGSVSRSSSISSSMSRLPVRYWFRDWVPAAGIIASPIIRIISSIDCIGCSGSSYWLSILVSSMRSAGRFFRNHSWFLISAIVILCWDFDIQGNQIWSEFNFLSYILNYIRETKLHRQVIASRSTRQE